MLNNQPEIDVERIKQEIREDVAQRERFGFFPERSKSMRVAIALRLSHIETLINAAHDKAQMRTQLPAKFNRFPLSLSRRLQRALLRIYHFAFKEQRSINSSLISALRESNALNHQLAKDIIDLQVQLGQLQVQALEATRHSTIEPDHPQS